MLQQKHTIKSLLAATTLSLLCLLTGGSVLATGSPTSSIQSVAQSYGAASNLQTGLIVKSSNKANTEVAPATYATASQMLGVTVAANAAPVTLSTSATPTGQQVYVASSGRYEVLVSNQDGVIASGDYITVSSLAGVGMKASGQGQILGRAAASFDGQHNTDSTTSLRDQNGRKVTVTLGRIPVDIAIGANPLAAKDGGYVPNFLQKAVQVVTSKSVSPWRIYTALIVLLVAILTGASLVYGGIRSSMIAIGRNPLAHGSITRNLIQIIVTSLIILIVGLFAAYFMLKI